LQAKKKSDSDVNLKEQFSVLQLLETQYISFNFKRKKKAIRTCIVTFTAPGAQKEALSVYLLLPATIRWLQI
jgi:hypothetical protein